MSRIGVNESDLALPAVGLVLSDQQQAFVQEYVQNGGKADLAASAAEYPEPAKDGRALLRLPSIQAGIRREQALAVAGLVHMSDKVLSDVLNSVTTDAKVKIAATRIAYERAGVLQEARHEADRKAAGGGTMAGMSVHELERVVAEAEARIAAASVQTIDLTPITPGSAPIAPGSDAPPEGEGQQSAIPDTTDTVSATQGEG